MGAAHGVKSHQKVEPTILTLAAAETGYVGHEGAMAGWYRIAFTQARVAEFSDALQNVHDTQRHANWAPETGVFVTDDLIHLASVPSLVINFPPSAAEVFASLINETRRGSVPEAAALRIGGTWQLGGKASAGMSRSALVIGFLN